MKKQLKAARKVAALKRVLKNSSKSERAAIKEQLAKAKSVLKKAAANVKKAAAKAAKICGNSPRKHNSEFLGVSELSPIVRQGTILTQKQKDEVKARCL